MPKAKPKQHESWHLPKGLLSAAAYGVRASAWLIRRPFLANRWIWSAALGTLLAGAGVALVAGQVIIGGACAVLAVIPAAIIAHWGWLSRGSQPIVLIALFEGRSPVGRDTAESHIGALQLFLQEDETL